jgi:hypothetical protein
MAGHSLSPCERLSLWFSQTVADKGRVNEIRIEFDDLGAGRELGLQRARFVGLVRQVF